jgi:D-serine deaminase-like pyridoxal phosphate-dependent protein
MDAFEENMRVMAALLEGGPSLRPHYKSHKSTAIAHRQMTAGAKGITCAKLGEARDLVFAGIKDVLIANQIVEPVKLAQAAYLAKCCRLTVCVDRADNIRALEAAAAAQDAKIHCLVEYEAGMRRCGVDTPEAFFALAQEISQSPHLVFEGIQAYAGQLSHEEDYETRRAQSQTVKASLGALRDFVRGRGLPIREISGVSTGTAEFHAKDSVYTEVQAGSYIFMDAAYGALKLRFHSALFVACTAISVNGSAMVVDAGRKSVSVDQKMPVFRDFPGAPVKVSEEHSSVCAQGLSPCVGGRFLMVPGHCCTTVNLHDHIYLVRKGEVVDRVPVTSRGRSE